VSPQKNAMHKLPHVRSHDPPSPTSNSNTAVRPATLLLTAEATLLAQALELCFQLAATEPHTTNTNKGVPHIDHPLLSTSSFMQGSTTPWCSVLLAMACFVGPWWTDSELQQQQRYHPAACAPVVAGHGTEDAVVAVQRQITVVVALVDRVFLEAQSAITCEQMMVSLLEVAAATSALLVHAWARERSSSSTPQALFAEAVVAALWAHIIEVAASSRDSASLSRAAVSAAFVVVNTFADNLPCRVPVGHDDNGDGNGKDRASALCEAAVTAFAALDVDAAAPPAAATAAVALDDEDIHDDPAGLRRAHARWLVAVNPQRIDADLRRWVTRDGEQPHQHQHQQVQGRSPIRRKSHVLRAMPALMRLSNSAACAPSLRQAAQRAIDSCDLPSLVESYLSLLDRVERAEHESAQLKEELRTFRAAGAMQF
jgi:hypothetical protein